MTESEWRNAAEPQAMLEFLHQCGKMSPRKHRLFAVACSRRIWDWIDPLGHAAVIAAENFADGLACPKELRAARLACQGAGGQAAWYAAATNPTIAAQNAARSAQAGVANNPLIGSEADELVEQAALVRDIYGLIPYQPSSIDPTCLTPAVVQLAQSIYDERTFDRMPQLADPLKEAGCHDADILAHCRGLGPHVRGCWVMDLILGRE